MNRLPKKGMWDYLDSVGVLENGTDAEIKAAKRAYRKMYHLDYKRNQRKKRPEYTVNFNEDTGEHDRVVLAAKNHDLSVPGFIREAVFAYMNRRYVVPNKLQIAMLEQLLSNVLNEIQMIAGKKEKFFWERNDKLEKIEKRIVKLELDIDELFRHPLILK